MACASHIVRSASQSNLHVHQYVQCLYICSQLVGGPLLLFYICIFYSSVNFHSNFKYNRDSILNKGCKELNKVIQLKSSLSEILLSHTANSVVYNVQWTYFTSQLTLLHFYCFYYSCIECPLQIEMPLNRRNNSMVGQLELQS